MKETINNRISRLRNIMQSAGIDACLIYGTDPHLSEYIPEYWQTRAFISGFTGSAGMVIITDQKAALWTDFRYFLQAESELSGTEIELVKMRTPGYPEPAEWLIKNLKPGAVVGTDVWCISVNQFRSMQNSLSLGGIILKETGDLLKDIWTDRPPLPEAEVYEHDLQFACTDRATKIEAICSELETVEADLQIITALDDLAWTFNLRGSDVECNPVFMGYAFISNDLQVLFVEKSRLSPELTAKLESEGIQISGKVYGVLEYRHLAPQAVAARRCR